MLNKTRRIVWTLLAVAFVLRLGVAVAAVTGPYDPYTRLSGDMRTFLSLAISMVRGEGFSMHYSSTDLASLMRGETVEPPPPSPASLKGPGYPLFLAALFALFGYNLYFVVFVQVCVSTLTPLFVYLIAREIDAKPIWALGFAAFYYPFALDSAYIMSEWLMTCMTAASLWLLIRPNRGVLAGVVAGATVLVKSVMFPFLALATLIDRRRMVFFWLGLALAVSPWIVRNYVHTGTPYLTPSMGGYQLILLHNPGNRDFPLMDPPGDLNEGYPGLQVAMRRALARSPRVDRPAEQAYLDDREFSREAVEFIRSDPRQFVRASVRSVVNTWRWDYPRAHWVRRLTNLVLYLGLLPFALWGSIRALRSGSVGARVVLCFLAYYVLSHGVMASEIRYRTIAMPAFFVMAAYGLDGLTRHWQSRRTDADAVA